MSVVYRKPMSKALVNCHVPHGDSYGIEIWNEERDHWEIWGFAEDFTEAIEIGDMARTLSNLPKCKTRIKKL